jgi:hypothetical protein
MRWMILIIGLLCGQSFASGGTCPSGANYVNPTNPTGSLVTLSTLGVTSCYFISAGGADTNSGTTEAAAWLHAPGMPNCANNCSSVSLTTGEGFIFRGGDTWHFGASTSPAVGGTWSWSEMGTSTAPEYIGVDLTWYSGGSWTRPVFNADNATSLNVSVSCSYTIGADNIMVSIGSNSSSDYVYFDDIALTGFCITAGSGGEPFGSDRIINAMWGQSTVPHVVVERTYIHGWTNTCSWGTTGNGSCHDNGQLNLFPGVGHILLNVVDGSDSYAGMASPDGNQAPAGYEIAYNVFNYISQGTPYSCKLVHDNLWENFMTTMHANILECFADSFSSVLAIYNNVIYNTCGSVSNGGTESGCAFGTVGIWPYPNNSPAQTAYIFNNVFYSLSTGIGNYWDIGNPESGTTAIGTQNDFNNTLEYADNGAEFGCSNLSSNPTNLANNYEITDNSSAYSGCNGSTPATFTTELHQTHSTSSGQTSSSTYGYYPLSNFAGIGQGTNETSNYCAALSTAAGSDSTLTDAANACLQDTRYGIAYNSTSHTVSSPGRTPNNRPSSGAWDIGAYEYSGASAPNGAGLGTFFAWLGGSL